MKLDGGTLERRKGLKRSSLYRRYSGVKCPTIDLKLQRGVRLPVKKIKSWKKVNFSKLAEKILVSGGGLLFKPDGSVKYIPLKKILKKPTC